LSYGRPKRQKLVGVVQVRFICERHLNHAVGLCFNDCGFLETHGSIPQCFKKDIPARAQNHHPKKDLPAAVSIETIQDPRRRSRRCGDVSGWLPLLAQTQAGIEAVEAAMRESLTP
jgi:hypothetical protein